DAGDRGADPGQLLRPHAPSARLLPGIRDRATRGARDRHHSARALAAAERTGSPARAPGRGALRGRAVRGPRDRPRHVAAPARMKPRVLVVSAEPVGARMAGPAIRAAELARALADDCEVSLAAPAPSALEDDRIDVVQAGLEDY